MRIRLGVPAYGGVQPATVRSLILTHHALYLCGHEVEIDLVSGGSVLPKVRNEIVQRFWNAGEDVLFFLDSDMAWNPVDVVRLVMADIPFSCANYRTKTEDARWVCYLETQEDGRPIVNGGMVKVMDAGTGFMCLRRDVIKRLRDAYPSLRYADKDGAEIFALFDFSLRNGAYWGEDYTFCDRWRAIGGEIWMLPDVTIDHIGHKAFTGNYHEYLLGLPGGSKENEQ